MKIVVLAGGLSSERDVSILSGSKVAAALHEFPGGLTQVRSIGEELCQVFRLKVAPGPLVKIAGSLQYAEGIFVRVRHGAFVQIQITQLRAGTDVPHVAGFLITGSSSAVPFVLCLTNRFEVAFVRAVTLQGTVFV